MSWWTQSGEPAALPQAADHVAMPPPRSIRCRPAPKHLPPSAFLLPLPLARWHAVVTDRHPGKGLRAYFLGSTEHDWVDDAECVRPGRIYVAGQWHPRPLGPDFPKGLLRHLSTAPQRPPKQQPQQQAAKGRQAQPASSNDENGGGDQATVLVRRSVRERESRIEMVDGKPVLKLNM